MLVEFCPDAEPGSAVWLTWLPSWLQGKPKQSTRTTRCRRKNDSEVNSRRSDRTVMRHKVFAVSLSQTRPKRNGARRGHASPSPAI